MRTKMGEKGLHSDDTRSIIKFTENKMTYKGINTNRRRVLRYQIDGGMFDNNQTKCDNAFGFPDTDDFYLIELKGKDLKHASVQIYDTIQALNRKIKCYTVHGRIICSKIPRPHLRSTQIVRLERELAKRGGRLIKKSILLEENI